MKTIHKYILDPLKPSVLMPEDARVLSVQVQPKPSHHSGQEQICIWAEVTTDSPTRPFLFDVVGTGHEIHENTYYYFRRFLGTVQMQRGTLVLHIYQVFDLMYKQK